jgi:Acetyltransferase (GNAT) domain
VATIRYSAAASQSPSHPQAVGVATVAWIAMVLVDPEERGRGVGTALLQRGLASVEDATVAGLDATPLGRPLYEKLGFTTDTTLTRMARPPGALQGSVPPPGTRLPQPRGAQDIALMQDESMSNRVRPVSAGDMGEIAQLDALATGLDRRAMLEWLHEGASDLACRTHSHTLDGYVLGRRGHNFIHLGPLIARSVADALALVRTCVARHPGEHIIVDAADDQPGWREGLEAMGFGAQRPFGRMYRGTWRPTVDARLLFASIGPEFG